MGGDTDKRGSNVGPLAIVVLVLTVLFGGGTLSNRSADTDSAKSSRPSSPSATASDRPVSPFLNDVRRPYWEFRRDAGWGEIPVPDPKTADVGESLGSMLAADAPHVTAEFLIATVPDPIDSRLGSRFDAIIESLQMSAAAGGWSFDCSWLPWRPSGRQLGEGDRLSPSNEGVAEPLHSLQPGLILFHKTVGGRRRVLLMFLVGEVPTAGVAKEPLRQSLEVIRRYREGRVLALANWLLPGPAGLRAINAPGNLAAWFLGTEFMSEVRLVGPLYSGSETSLTQALSGWLRGAAWGDGRWAPRWHVRVRSGSATVIDHVEFPKNVLSGAGIDPGKNVTVEFDSTLLHDHVTTEGLLRHLESVNGEKPLGKVVILSELNTVFGETAKRSITEPEGREAADRTITYMFFPFHISQLAATYERRVEQAGKGASKIVGPSTRLPIPFDTTSEPREQVPSLAPEMTSVTSEFVLSKTIETICNEEYRYVGIVASDFRDTIFLASLIRRYHPDVQLFSLSPNVMLGHPKYAESLRGMIVGSTYPLSSSTQLWVPPARGMDRRHLFSDEADQGTYNAAVSLIEPSKPDLLFDYGGPVEAAKAGVPGRPGLWISVVGQRGLWPVSYEPDPFIALGAEPKRGYTYGAPATEPSTSRPADGPAVGWSWLIAAIAVLLLAWALFFKHPTAGSTGPVGGPGFLRLVESAVPACRDQPWAWTEALWRELLVLAGLACFSGLFWYVVLYPVWVASQEGGGPWALTAPTPYPGRLSNGWELLRFEITRFLAVGTVAALGFVVARRLGYARLAFPSERLRLMRGVKDVNDVPAEGSCKNLTVVAEVGGVLHFRMFDGRGKILVDVGADDEELRTDPARQKIARLRERLAPLWAPHSLTEAEKDEVIAAVSSVIRLTIEGVHALPSAADEVKNRRLAEWWANAVQWGLGVGTAVVVALLLWNDFRWYLGPGPLFLIGLLAVFLWFSLTRPEVMEDPNNPLEGPYTHSFRTSIGQAAAILLAGSLAVVALLALPLPFEPTTAESTIGRRLFLERALCFGSGVSPFVPVILLASLTIMYLRCQLNRIDMAVGLWGRWHAPEPPPWVSVYIARFRGVSAELIKPKGGVGGIPKEWKRKNCVIVAKVGETLHLRVFDKNGAVVADVDGKNQPRLAKDFKDLEAQLAGLWPPHVLTGPETRRVIAGVTSIVGQAGPSGYAARRIGSGRRLRRLTTRYEETMDAVRYWWPRRSAGRWLGLAAVGLAGVILLRILSLSVASADFPGWYSWALMAWVCFLGLTVLTTLSRLLYLSRKYGALLKSFVELPMAPAFDRLPPMFTRSFGRYLDRDASCVDSLKIPVQQWALVADGLESPEIWKSLSRRYCAGGAEGQTLTLDDFQGLVKAITLDESGGDPTFPWTRGQGTARERVTARFANEFEMTWSPRLKVDPAWQPHIAESTTWNHLRGVARACLDLLDAYWDGKSMAASYGDDTTRGSGSTPVEDFGLAEDEKGVAAWLRAAEDLVALEVVILVSQIGAQIKNLVGYLAVAPILLLITVSTYPFIPQRFLQSCFWALVVMVVAAVVWVYIRMERNELLSRISRTTPNNVEFDRQFLGSILPFVIPLLAIVLAQFPFFSDTMSQWFEPLLRVVR